MSATLAQLANDAVLDIHPGDQHAAIEVERWLQDYATSRDPQPRVVTDFLTDPATPAHRSTPTVRRAS